MSSYVCFCFSTDKPCHSTIEDMLQSADIVRRLCKLVDCKTPLCKSIASGLEVSREDYNDMYSYREYGTHLITEMILNKAVEIHGDRFKVCHLLNIIKKNGHPNIAREVFGLHTGNGGPCFVCTRDLFG